MVDPFLTAVFLAVPYTLVPSPQPRISISIYIGAWNLIWDLTLKFRTLLNSKARLGLWYLRMVTLVVLTFLFVEMILLVLLIRRLLVGIYCTGNILLPTKSIHRTLFGSRRLISSYSQCLKSSRWNRSVKSTLEIFRQTLVGNLDNNLLPLHQVIGWNLPYIKIALAIKTVLVFFPLIIIHRRTAHLFPLNNACA